jgi:hypothetical protein
VIFVSLYFIGPLKIEARCEDYEDEGFSVLMYLILLNPTEDMLVYGYIDEDSGMNNSPIGATKYQVLDKGDRYEEVMWFVSGSGNNVSDGAISVMTLTTHQSYYVGWDGDSFVGLSRPNEELEGGGNCALSGVFNVAFPELHSSKAGK